MAAYSPISSRNHRIAPPYHISNTANSVVQSNVVSGTAAAAGAAGAAAASTAIASTFHGNLSGSSRRRESANSSIGATSIRRLLTVNRGCRHKISVNVRAKVAKNFTLLIVAHGLMCAVLIPLFGLQVKINLYFLFLPQSSTYHFLTTLLNYFLVHFDAGIKFIVVSSRDMAVTENRSECRTITVEFMLSHHIGNIAIDNSTC